MCAQWNPPKSDKSPWTGNKCPKLLNKGAMLSQAVLISDHISTYSLYLLKKEITLKETHCTDLVKAKGRAVKNRRDFSKKGR